MGKSLFLRGETDKVMEVYARAKIFCMPSLFEGFGLVTAEALAKGLPAIGFVDCPGTNTLIRDGVNGLLVEPAGSRAASLAEALEQLMVDPRMRDRLGKAGPLSVQQFQPAQIQRRWTQVVNDVIEGERLPIKRGP